jgi:DNA modification methylase
LIEQASQPGGLVLDPFCGSGNVGRAARGLGRRALIADIAPEVAAARLRNAIAAPEGA